jgi:hypothetical protein
MKEQLLNVKNIERRFFSSNNKGILYQFWLYFGLLLITAISLINLELEVPGVQYIDYNQLQYLVPAVVPTITKLNPGSPPPQTCGGAGIHYITGFTDGEGCYHIGIETSTIRYVLVIK